MRIGSASELSPYFTVYEFSVVGTGNPQQLIASRSNRISLTIAKPPGTTMIISTKSSVDSTHGIIMTQQPNPTTFLFRHQPALTTSAWYCVIQAGTVVQVFEEYEVPAGELLDLYTEGH